MNGPIQRDPEGTPPGPFGVLHSHQSSATIDEEQNTWSEQPKRCLGRRFPSIVSINRLSSGCETVSEDTAGERPIVNRSRLCSKHAPRLITVRSKVRILPGPPSQPITTRPLPAETRWGSCCFRAEPRHWIRSSSDSPVSWGLEHFRFDVDETTKVRGVCRESWVNSGAGISGS